MQTGPSRSMLRTLFHAIRLEGIRTGAYAGLSASLARQMTYSITRFGVYDHLKLLIAQSSKQSHGDVTKLSPGMMALAASVAGAAGGVAGNPADVILVRMISDANHPASKRKGYRHWWAVSFNFFILSLDPPPPPSFFFLLVTC